MALDPHPSRCYINVGKSEEAYGRKGDLSDYDQKTNRIKWKKKGATHISIKSKQVVFNARPHAQDATLGKYDKICGEFVKTAEITAPHFQFNWEKEINFRHRLWLFDADARELKLRTNQPYWFMKRDGSRQVQCTLYLMHLNEHR